MVAKPKINLDLQKIKTFGISHVEKIVFGLFGLIVLILLYKTFGLERVTQRPNDLRVKVQAARQNLERSVFKVDEAGIVVKDYSEKAKQVTKKLTLAGYEWEPVRPSVWPPGDKRGRPQLLAIEDIKVSTGLAMFDLAAEMQPARTNQESTGDRAATERAATEKDDQKGRAATRRASRLREPKLEEPAPPSTTAQGPQGLRYAVVLGLVPLERQTKEFLDRFRNVAMPTEADRRPHYRRGWVQRAEVVPGAADDKLKWEWLDARTGENAKIKGRLASGTEELAAASVVDPALTEPLPRLHSGQWNAAEVVHDKLPLARKGGAGETRVEGDTQRREAPPPPAGDALDPLAAEPAAAPAAQPKQEEPKADEVKEPDYLLFRYFDFTLKPGKTYKYRVVLAMDNPNFGIDEDQLEDPSLGKKEVVFSPTSDPSPAVAAPFGGSFFAGDLIAATADREVAASVAVEQMMETGGRAEQVVSPVFRGRLANFKLDEPVLVSENNADPKLAAKDKPVQVQTECAVLDMAPGDGQTKAADLLVMDPSGRLIVRKSASEHARFEDIAQRVKDAKKKPREKEDSADQLSDSKKPAKERRRGGGGLAERAQQLNPNVSP